MKNYCLLMELTIKLIKPWKVLVFSVNWIRYYHGKAKLLFIALLQDPTSIIVMTSTINLLMNVFPTEYSLSKIRLHWQSYEDLLEKNYTRNSVYSIHIKGAAGDDCFSLIGFFITKSVNIFKVIFHPWEFPQDNQIHFLLFFVEPNISKTPFYPVS